MKDSGARQVLIQNSGNIHGYLGVACMGGGEGKKTWECRKDQPSGRGILNSNEQEGVGLQGQAVKE